MDFSGEHAQEELKVPSIMDPTRQIASYHDAELATFFKRPVRIYSGDWDQASSFNVLLDPWALYFADPRVINRVTHYNLARCTLCVKFVLSGNPFLYGQLIASYMPYPNETSTISTTNDGRTPHGTGIPTELVLASQRPHVTLTPMMSEGACMRLPFFYQYNWFQVETGSWVDIGHISIQVINQLKHANAGTEPVSVNVFAWAEDMELSVPTSSPAYGMVAQAGMDEYDSKPSAPASILNTAISAARHVPALRPYAMATSIAAGAVRGAAAALGYSRPLQLQPPTIMAQDPLHNFANTDLEDSSSKLTVDSKQGVSIDNRVMGLDGTDPMGILSMSQIESYFHTFTWPVGDAPDTHLFSVPVTPMLYQYWGVIADDDVTAPTAIAAASLPFRRWRGTIIFRFQVICTQYHKGRLRVVYDPYYLASLTKFNVNYTKIVDLAEVNEFEMSVSWADDKLLLLVNSPGHNSTSPVYSTSTPYVSSQLYDNGAISVLVLNSLTAPNSSIDNDVGVNVYVRAGEDFELYEPRAQFTQDVLMTPQAGFDELDNPMDNLSVGNPTDGSDLSHVVIGERVVSFRQLLKRYMHYLTAYVSAPSTGVNYTVASFRDFPLTPGSDDDGLHTSVALAKDVNMVSLTLLSYLSSMFAAYRGSIRYKHFITNVKTGAPTNCITHVYRYTSPTTTAVPSNVSDVTSPLTTVAYNAVLRNRHSYNGTAIVCSHHKPMIEVELPYYSDARFLLTRPLRNNANSGSSHFYVSQRPQSSLDFVESWVSIGEDFNFGFFTGANLWYYYYLEP